jgi:Ni,Fe-hydrogenase maturation factor
MPCLDPTPSTLLLAYGNPDRMDDGLAWHVLAGLIAALGGAPPASPDEPLTVPAGQADARFVLQLTPELAELVSHYDRVCFIDAHVDAHVDAPGDGDVADEPAETRLAPLEPVFTHSPFTHHLTPATCLALSQALYGRAPAAVLASARGDAFGFSRALSPAAAARVPGLVRLILAWLAAEPAPLQLDAHP